MIWDTFKDQALTSIETSGRKAGTVKRYRVSLNSVTPFLSGERLDQINQKRPFQLVAERLQPRIIRDERGQ